MASCTESNWEGGTTDIDTVYKDSRAHETSTGMAVPRGFLVTELNDQHTNQTST